MEKTKKKICRKYQDFYTLEDLRNPDTIKPINLSIADFDAKGHLTNPRAPCVVTVIDPSYIKDAREQSLPKKFRMKTDILRLREITRKKFMIYATQERYLEKQRDVAHQEQVYKSILEFFKFADESLKRMESEAFAEMQQSMEELKKIQALNIREELKRVEEEHQRVVMETHDVFQRFLFLLKLISYFDEIADEAETSVEQEGTNSSAEKSVLMKPKEIIEINLAAENAIDQKEDIEKCKNYMDAVVRPYLSKRTHLNADIWMKGYEKIRHKIFNYNRRFTNIALLNHIVTVIYIKFQKTYAARKTQPILKDPNFMRERATALKGRVNKICSAFARKYKQDKLNAKLNGIIPVILKNVEESIFTNNEERADDRNGVEQEEKATSSKSRPASAASAYKDEQEGNLLKVEKIQAHLLSLLNELDAMPPELCKTVEKRVQRRMYMEKEMSRRALVKQTRLKNWVEHFKKHELQKPKSY